MRAVVGCLGVTVVLVAMMATPQGFPVWESLHSSVYDWGSRAALATTLDASSSVEPQSADISSSSGPVLLAEYEVPGNPHAVSVEAPGRIWFTLPQQNLIGRLVVTSTVDYAVATYGPPTSGSSPYDVVYAAGYVWFTEQQGNKIGRLDPGTGVFSEFPIPTAASVPTGIAVLPGTPTYVWFTERSGDRLGRLVFTDTHTWTMSEYPLPAGYENAELEDIAVANSGTVWFTAPAIGYLGRFNTSTGFAMRSLPGGGEPWSVKVAAGGLPVWFTDRSGDRVGAYFPTTISDFRVFPFYGTDRAPYDLVLMDGRVWCTEELGERLTVLQPSPMTLRSYGVESGSLRGLDADVNRHLWFAMSDAMKIGEWRPPYFHRIYLTLVTRGY